MKLNEHAISAGPLLKAIAQTPDPTNKALAEATGRDGKNMARDLERLAEAGWIALDGKRRSLTDEGRAILAALQRAEDPAGALEIPLHLIDEKPGFNPRHAVDEEADADLAGSVGDSGVLQPILIRLQPEPGRFWVVAGHRRRKAALAAGLLTIPAKIREFADDDEALDAAMLENVQREDMTPLDEAVALQGRIASLQAKDPALTLKGAKEIVAQRLRKTVRFVELRLNLIQLPAVMKVQMQAGKLGAGEARKFLQSRPKPLDLPDDHWLLIAEILDKQTREPCAGFYPEGCECAPVAAEDPRLDALRQPGLMGPNEIEDADRWRTGRFQMRAQTYLAAHVVTRFDVDLDDAAQRESLMARLRDACGIEGLRPGEYVTPWLNGPFEVAPETLAKIAAERAQAAADAVERARQRAEDEADAEARADAARARLASAQSIAATCRPRKPLDAQFEAILAGGSRPLPWRVTPNGGLLAANGEAILQGWHSEPPADVLARATLIAVAVNAAGGMATPQATPAEAAEEPEPFEDPEPGDDEVDDEDEAGDVGAEGDGFLAPIDDDAEIPSFLRRLAGGGGREARPL